jgi:polar amino acid transport system substrate-binding protein
MFPRRLFAVVLAISAMLASTAAEAAGELQDIIKRGTLRIGYIPSPPQTIKDPRTGELSGTYIDGAKAIVAEMGLKPEWVETTWGTFAAGLQSGQIDICVAGVFQTVRRAMAVDFTKPIFYMGYSAVVRKDDDRFQKIDDMNKEDVKIAVVQGGAAEDFARRFLPKAQLVSLATGNLTAPFIEVLAGRADAGFEDVGTVARFVEQQPSVKDLFAAKPFNFLPVGWTVRKGNTELASVINAGIDTMMLSGRWDAIAHQYVLRAQYRVDMPNYTIFPSN